jgi:hypothetical protein
MRLWQELHSGARLGTPITFRCATCGEAFARRGDQFAHLHRCGHGHPAEWDRARPPGVQRPQHIFNLFAQFHIADARAVVENRQQLVEHGLLRERVDEVIVGDVNFVELSAEKRVAGFLRIECLRAGIKRA